MAAYTKIGKQAVTARRPYLTDPLHCHNIHQVSGNTTGTKTQNNYQMKNPYKLSGPQNKKARSFSTEIPAQEAKPWLHNS